MYMLDNLTSSTVAGAVQAEWSRRQTTSTTALYAKQSYNKGNKPKNTNTSYNNSGSGYNSSKDKWCDVHSSQTHSNSECVEYAR